MAFEICEIFQTSASGEMAATGGILKISREKNVTIYGFCIWFYMVLYGFIWFYMVFIWYIWYTWEKYKNSIRPSRDPKLNFFIVLFPPRDYLFNDIWFVGVISNGSSGKKYFIVFITQT